jgi:hypothetical protein
VFKSQKNHYSLPDLLKKFENMYLTQSQRVKDRVINLSNTQITFASYLTSSILDSKLTNKALALLRVQRELAPKYVITFRPLDKSYIVVNGQVLPGKFDSIRQHKVLVDLGKSALHCSCGFTKNTLLPCRHIIAVTQKSNTIEITEYDFVLKMCHYRWSINAQADVEDFGASSTAYESLYNSFNARVNSDAEWKHYFNPVQRFNEISSRIKSLGDKCQHDQAKYEICVQGLIKLNSAIDNSSLFNINNPNSYNLDEIMGINNVNNDSSKILVNDPPKHKHSGSDSKSTNSKKNRKRKASNKNKCSSCHLFGHKAGSTNCTKLAQHNAKKNKKAEVNNTIRTNQMNSYHLSQSQ